MWNGKVFFIVFLIKQQWWELWELCIWNKLHLFFTVSFTNDIGENVELEHVFTYIYSHFRDLNYVKSVVFVFYDFPLTNDTDA